MKHLILFFILTTNIVFAQSFDIEDVSAYQEDDFVMKYSIGNFEIRKVLTGHQEKDLDSIKTILKNIGYSEVRKNPRLKQQHLFAHQNSTIAKNLYENFISYFISYEDLGVMEISFGSLDRTPKTDVDFSILKLIFNKIPKKNINTKERFLLAGREIILKKNWKWVDVNDLADPNTGERMNFSLHQSLTKAQEMNEMQKERGLLAIKNPPVGNTVTLISDSKETIYFEGVKTKAQKLVFHLSNSDYNTSTNFVTYYVSAEVRGKFVACVLSFYEIDNYNQKNLPPLLSTFIKF